MFTDFFSFKDVDQLEEFLDVLIQAMQLARLKPGLMRQLLLVIK